MALAFIYLFIFHGTVIRFFLILNNLILNVTCYNILMKTHLEWPLHSSLILRPFINQALAALKHTM